jgi:hypothetical protein
VSTLEQARRFALALPETITAPALEMAGAGA